MNGGPVVPSNYVQIVDSNDCGVGDKKSAPPPNACSNDDSPCPFNLQQKQQHPLSSATSTFERNRTTMRTSYGVSGSQSTLNTFCSSSRKSQQPQGEEEYRKNPNAVFNRLYNSDPNTNMLNVEITQLTDDPNYVYNYAHIKHSHRHPHYHFRRQSQPEELRVMSQNSSSVKSFTSQSFNNPEYFKDDQEMRQARSYDDSRASLLSRKLSNQIMLLNSELALLEQMRDHSQSYPKINLIEKDYLNLMETTTLQQRHNHYPKPTSTSSESSDASEFHENKTSTLDRKTSSITTMQGQQQPIPPPVPPPRKHLFSETDSYSTLNDEITQLVSKHFSDSIKRLISRRFYDVDSSYELPSNIRRRHSCGSSESLDDVIIPELFNSPSRIKWSFLMGLPDLSRSHSQIGSSDYKTDEYDDDEEEEDNEDEVDGEEEDDINSTILRPSHVCKIDQILRGNSSLQHHHDRDKTVSIWQTSTRASSDDCSRAVIFHHDSGLVENCCDNHFKMHDGSASEGAVKKSTEEDSTTYEFELCTKENCEYLLQSQIETQPNVEDHDTATAMSLSSQMMTSLPISDNKKNQLNNEPPKFSTSTVLSTSDKNNQKNINLKHNKFKMKKRAKKKSAVQMSNRNQQQTDDLLMWSKLNLSHIMKKESCVIDSVNLKPNSNSSSSTSLNNVASASRKNLAKCYKKSSTKLRQLPSGSLDIATLILASSSSTQARLRSDGAMYFSNPDLSAIPADLRNMTTQIDTSVNTPTGGVTDVPVPTSTNNNSCQFINNDLRNNSTNNNNSLYHVNRRNFAAHVSAQRRRRAVATEDSRTNYLNLEESSINSNNMDMDSYNSDMMMRQEIHLRRRLRYNQFNLHGIVRRAQRRARKYFNSFRK